MAHHDQQPPRSARPDRPAAAVVVAARNAAATIAACVRSLGRLEYPGVEVIVVDDGSEDQTGPIAAAAGARVIRRAAPEGPSAARNAAVGATEAAIVAFTDADCTVDSAWLARLVDGLTDSGAAGAGGRQVNVFAGDRADEARSFDAFFTVAGVVSAYTRSDGVARFVNHVASCSSAYTRDAFLSVGGFSEDLFPGEDVDLDLRLRRAGHRCYYVPTAIVYHQRPGTRLWFARMMRRYGRAERELVRRHGRFRFLHYVPVLLGLWIAAHALLTVPAMRPVIVGTDVAAGLLGLILLARGAPVSRWPAVIQYAVIAMVAWHRGWFSTKVAS